MTTRVRLARAIEKRDEGMEGTRAGSQGSRRTRETSNKERMIVREGTVGTSSTRVFTDVEGNPPKQHEACRRERDGTNANDGCVRSATEGKGGGCKDTWVPGRTRSKRKAVGPGNAPTREDPSRKEPCGGMGTGAVFERTIERTVADSKLVPCGSWILVFHHAGFLCCPENSTRRIARSAGT